MQSYPNETACLRSDLADLQAKLAEVTAERDRLKSDVLDHDQALNILVEDFQQVTAWARQARAALEYQQGPRLMETQERLVRECLAVCPESVKESHGG